MRLWDFGGQGCRGWVDNILEDASLGSSASSRNVAQQEVWFLPKSSRYFRNDRDVVDALSSGEKLISFIFQLNVHLDYFLQNWRGSQPPYPHRGEQLRVRQKGGHYLASCTQFLVKSQRTEFSWDFGNVVLSQRLRDGGNIQKFESVNKRQK